MKAIFTHFKIALVLLIIAAPGKLLAQVPDVILHNGTSAIINASGYTFAANDEVVWEETYNNGTTTTNPIIAPKLYNAGNPSATSHTVTTADGAGLHTYKMRVKSGTTGCYSDYSDPKTVYILPNINIAFVDATADNYCENVGSPSKAIVAKAEPSIPALAPLPGGIGYSYLWTVTKNGAPVSDLTTVGSLPTAGTTTLEDQSTFTMTTDSPGEYIFTVNVKYFTLSNNPNPNSVKLGVTPLSFATAVTKKITVVLKPTKPNISII